MEKKYDVFMSCKSEDYEYAEEVYNFLNSNGISTFLASKELRKMGDSEYRNAIMQALESACHLIIFASKPEYIESKWVFYEWDTFVNAKLSGRKDGQIMTILKGFNTQKLRLDLIKYESFSFDDYKEILLSYVETPESRRIKEEQKRQEESLRQQAAIEAQKRIEEERQACIREEEYKKELAKAEVRTRKEKNAETHEEVPAKAETGRRRIVDNTHSYKKKWSRIIKDIFTLFIELFVEFTSDHAQYILFFIHITCLIGLCYLNLIDSFYMMPSLCASFVLAIVVCRDYFGDEGPDFVSLLIFAISFLGSYLLYQVPRWGIVLLVENIDAQNHWTFLFSYLVCFIQLFIYYKVFSLHHFDEEKRLIVSSIPMLLVYVVFWYFLCYLMPFASLSPNTFFELFNFTR